MDSSYENSTHRNWLTRLSLAFKKIIDRSRKSRVFLTLVILATILTGGIICLVCSITIYFVSYTFGSNEVVTTKREIGSLNSVRLEGQGKLIILQGKSEGIEIKAPEKVIARINTKVKNNTLVISNKSFLWFSPRLSSEITYYVTVKDINSLSLSGSSEIEMTEFKTSELHVNISGSTKGNISITARELKVDVSGSADLTVSGTVDLEEVSVTGSMDYHALSLESKETHINVSGSGNIEVQAKEVLDITIAGSGNVKYSGDPVTINQTVSGSGKIEKVSK